ncbi:MAG: DUF362 domain-containing protein [candidate division WOR-3 bacterium]
MQILRGKSAWGVEMSPAIVWFVPVSRIKEGLGVILEDSGFFQRTKPKKKLGIKVHFGEEGNNNHLDPDFVRIAALRAVKHDLQPVVIETTSLYRGRRQRASEHLKLAKEHGFTIERTLVPIEILDGEFGERYYTVEVQSPQVSRAFLAQGLRFIRYLINLAHFKGHFVCGFGGAIKNLAMGLAAKAGKLAMHSSSKPYVEESKCASCGTCVDYCPHDAIDFFQYVARIGKACTGCGSCVAVCPYGAIRLKWDEASESVQKKMADYCLAVLTNRQAIHFNFAINITPNCDCNTKTERPIMPDIGLFASFDPVACDQAVLDRTQEKLKELYPNLNPEIVLERGEEIGLGTRRYELKGL